MPPRARLPVTAAAVGAAFCAIGGAPRVLSSAAFGSLDGDGTSVAGPVGIGLGAVLLVSAAAVASVRCVRARRAPAPA
jgi:hypothetical protein